MNQKIVDILKDSGLDESYKHAIREAFGNVKQDDFTETVYTNLKQAVADAKADQAAVQSDPVVLLHKALDRAMFGTLGPREGSTRLGHAKDGWRHGVACPFVAKFVGLPSNPNETVSRMLRILGPTKLTPGDPLVFDTCYDAGEDRRQFETLHALIDLGVIGP